MTEKELSQMFYLLKEMERLQKDIDDIRSRIGYKSPMLSDMPRGAVKDYTDEVDELADLEAMLNINLRMIQRERRRLEQYIGGVADAEVRLIMRLRHINCLTWERIGEELHTHRTTVTRKYYKYLKVAHNAHEKCDTM